MKRTLQSPSRRRWPYILICLAAMLLLPGGLGAGIVTSGSVAPAHPIGVDPWNLGDGDLTVGWVGYGAMTVTGGSDVSDFYGNIGNGTHAGFVSIVDAGSTWTNAAVHVGLRGFGTLNIGTDALVSGEAGSVATGLNGAGVVAIDNGGMWRNTEDLVIGRDGTGTVSIVYTSSPGCLVVGDVANPVPSGLVVSDSDAVGDGLWIQHGSRLSNQGGAVVGYRASQHGKVIVTGANSLWENKSLSSQTLIADSGTALVSIENGGEVSLHGYAVIGNRASSAGLVNVTGSESYFRPSGGLSAGSLGSGTVSVLNGGHFDGNVVYLGSRGTGVGVAKATGSGSTFNTTDFYIGSGSTSYSGANGTGSFTLSGGATSNSNNAYIGYAGGSAGGANVTGNGSVWSVHPLYNGILQVGGAGSGSLTVTNSGEVYSGLGYVAGQPGGVGMATISGSGSTWQGPQISVADAANAIGTLNILSGGLVWDSFGQVGRYDSALAAVNVDGLGSLWRNSNQFRIDGAATSIHVSNGGRIIVGNIDPATAGPDPYESMILISGAPSGSATLLIANGGVLDNTGSYSYMGWSSGHIANANISNPGSEWDNYGLVVGKAGQATISIGTGGTMFDAVAYIGDEAGSIGYVDMKGDSSWTNTNFLIIGNHGQGSLNTNSGPQLYGSMAYLGYSADGYGWAYLFWADTRMTLTSALEVGYRGTGSMTVVDGAALSAPYIYIGDLGGSRGELMVASTGTGSCNFLYTGHSGEGTLRLPGGGSFSTGYAYVGDQATGRGTISLGSAGRVSVNADLFLGGSAAADGGVGTLSLTGTDARLYVGDCAATGSFSGTALAVSDDDATGGQLYIRHGSSVTVAGDCYLGIGAGQHGAITLAGASSRLATGGLFVGRLGVGTFTHAEGSVQAASLTVGAGPWGTSAAGLYSLSGGTLNCTTSAWIAAGGAGTFNQYGGNAQFAALSIGSGTGSHGAYNLIGSSNCTVTGNATIGFDGAGTWAIAGAGATINVDGMLSVYGGGTISYSAGTFRIGVLNIDAGKVLVAAGANRALYAKFLQMANAGKLDLADNDMILDYAGPSPLYLISHYIRTGALNNWSNNYLTSSRAATSPNPGEAGRTGLGYGEASLFGITTFDGIPIDYTTILIKYTYLGDASLNGQVDVVDLGALASNWQSTGYWSDGDFNYDGFVDVVDLGILATNWQVGVTDPLGPQSLAEALSSFGLPSIGVPEPGALALCAGLAAVLRRRRTRR